MMDDRRWEATAEYLDEVFGQEPTAFREIREAATAAGLPPIAVSPAVGRLLSLLASTAGATRILEIGTLGGYSTAWLASAAGPDGRVITVEYDERHAEHAERTLAAHGFDRVEVKRGDGHEVARALLEDLGPAWFDLAFVDAEKHGYPDYWRELRSMVRVGGLLLFDNALGTGSTWIDRLDSDSIRATDELNRMAAADPDFEAACVPIREGLLIARRRR